MEKSGWEMAAYLSGDDGQAAIARAGALLAAGDALTAGQALRKEGLEPEQATSALQQAELRTLAAARYGITADLLLTREGLEQATRPEVSRHRAALIAAAGSSVIDLTAGLGFDSMAFAAAGCAVTCVERDPATAAMLRANLSQVNPSSATVIEADCREIELPADAIVFVDPARRAGARTADGRRAQSERDPERWSPPLSFVLSLAESHRVALKTAPGFGDLPAGWHGEWISVDRTPVEAALYSWPAFAERRRAVILHGDHECIVPGDAASAETSTVETWLMEADPVITLADAFGSIAGEGARIIGTDWITGPQLIEHPALRGYRVIEEVSADARLLRTELRERGVGIATVKSRHSGIEAGAFHRDLRLDTSLRESVTIALIRLEGRVHAYLVEPPH